MAKEIVAWCDLHLARDGAQVPASTVQVALDLGQPVELDLCEPCDKELVEPLRLLLAEHGQPVVHQQRTGTGSKGSSKPKPLTCPECGKGYAQQRSLDRHIEGEHSPSAIPPTERAPVMPNEAGLYVCPECSREFGKPQGVGRHRLAMHGVVGTSRKHPAGDAE